jgi:flagellar basal-body rod protein FlgF
MVVAVAPGRNIEPEAGIMDNATTIALSRLAAQERAIDVSATNIANAATPGYHGERMLFSDWMVRETAPGRARGDNALVYTQDSATYRDTAPGPLTHTGNPLDIAMANDGFFTVQTPRGPRLTRAGHFELNSNGTIVDGQNEPLLDVAGQPIQISTADGTLTVAGDGTLSSDNGQIAKIGVVTPANPQAMRAEGSRLFDANGPTTPLGSPKIVDGAIEDSNIQPTQEMTRMMDDMREFQFVSQFVQGEADRQQGAIDKITQKRS